MGYSVKESIKESMKEKIMPPLFLGIPILLLSCLIGCSSAPDSDVIGFVEETKAEKPKQIEKLPSFPKFEPYQYSATNFRDPFQPEMLAAAPPTKKVYTGPKPDIGRPRELLETYPLDSLRMVGSLERSGTFWALILDPIGIVHRVGVGNYMGENFGKIVKINEKSIELHEFVSDGEGGYRERDVQLRLSAEQGK